MVARGGFSQAMRDLIGDVAERLDVSTDSARLYPDQNNKNNLHKEAAVGESAVVPPLQNASGTFKSSDINERSVMDKASPVADEENFYTMTISKGTAIRGDIISDRDIELCGNLNGSVKTKGSLRITGSLIGDASAKEMTLLTSEVRGNMTCATEITIDDASVVYGNVQADSIILNGKIRGNIKVKKGAILQDNAVLWGNLEAGSISIDQGAKLEGEIKIIFDKACKDLFDDKVAVAGMRSAVTVPKNMQSTASTSVPAAVSLGVSAAAAGPTTVAASQIPALNALRNSINNAASGVTKDTI